MSDKLSYYCKYPIMISTEVFRGLYVIYYVFSITCVLVIFKKLKIKGACHCLHINIYSYN
jgi:hypothetical protein